MNKKDNLKDFILDLVKNDDHFGVQLLPTIFGDANKKNIVFLTQTANIGMSIVYNSKSYGIYFNVTDEAEGTVVDSRKATPLTFNFNNTAEFGQIMDELLTIDFGDNEVYINGASKVDPTTFKGILVYYKHAPAVMMTILDLDKYQGNYVYSKMLGKPEEILDVHTAIEKALNPNDVFYSIISSQKKKS